MQRYWAENNIAFLAGLAIMLIIGIAAMAPLEPSSFSKACDVACPCDAPVVEVVVAQSCGSDCADDVQSCGSLTAEIDAAELLWQSQPLLAFTVDRHDDSDAPPCPLDCPDCHCQGGQAVAGITPVLAPLLPTEPQLTPRPQWGCGPPQQTINTIFHPPRSLTV